MILPRLKQTINKNFSKISIKILGQQMRAWVDELKLYEDVLIQSFLNV